MGGESLQQLIEKHARIAVLMSGNHGDAYRPTPDEANALKNMRHILQQFAAALSAEAPQQTHCAACICHVGALAASPALPERPEQPLRRVHISAMLAADGVPYFEEHPSPYGDYVRWAEVSALPSPAAGWQIAVAEVVKELRVWPPRLRRQTDHELAECLASLLPLPSPPASSRDLTGDGK